MPRRQPRLRQDEQVNTNESVVAPAPQEAVAPAPVMQESASKNDLSSYSFSERVVSCLAKRAENTSNTDMEKQNRANMEFAKCIVDIGQDKTSLIFNKDSNANNPLYEVGAQRKKRQMTEEDSFASKVLFCTDHRNIFNFKLRETQEDHSSHDATVADYFGKCMTSISRINNYVKYSKK